MWMLGGFRVSVGSRPVEAERWRLRKAAGLVKLLALAPGHALHRKRITDLLWPELGARSAANNLHRVLHAARGSLGVSRPAASRRVLLQGEMVALCPDAIIETVVSDTDPGTGNKINLQPSVTTSVTINLVAGPAPEIKNGGGTSTVNWSGNVIDRVESYSGGDDVIDGNPVANSIVSQNGVSVVSSGGGSDFVNVFDSAPGDTVNCGGSVIVPDNDAVYRDAGDTVTNCEVLLP